MAEADAPAEYAFDADDVDEEQRRIQQLYSQYVAADEAEAAGKGKAEKQARGAGKQPSASGQTASDAGDAENDKKKKKKRKRPPNTSIYITGLPEDVTEKELTEFCSKCGIIKLDESTGDPKVRVYRNEDGIPKGDATVTFLMKPSVENALLLLDGARLRASSAKPINVEKAHFDYAKIEGTAEKRPKTSARPVATAKRQNLLLSWDEGDDRFGLRIVIIKHMHTPAEFDEPGFKEELERDIFEECSKLGQVDKITVFARNPEGAVAVKFVRPSSADKCIELMNGRFFAGRRLECDYFDGKTDYRVKESVEEVEKRVDDFGKWLDDGSDDDDGDDAAAAEQGSAS